jgi:hypothetical protein
MWIVVNIGCIECGVSSNLVGVFETEQQADEIVDKLENEASWRQGGQNSYQTFRLGLPGVVTEEYVAYLS